MNTFGKRLKPSSDSAADSFLPSKKSMEAPASSISQSFDIRRAEKAHRHVQALNTQFASWVQSQLQNHPDELWEDGVKDYLSHASDIMVEFKDVVDWLKLKAAKQESISGQINDHKALLDAPKENRQTLNSAVENGSSKQASPKPAAVPSDGEKKLAETENTRLPLFPDSAGVKKWAQTENTRPPLFSVSAEEKKMAQTENTKPPLFSDSVGDAAKQQTSFSFFQNTSSQSSGLFPFSQKPPTFLGSQVEPTPKLEASDDAEEEDEAPKPSSPSLEKHQEKGVIVVHEVKCKLYIKAENPADRGWKDMGIGQLSIKCREGAEKATKDSKPTIIVRNDVGKILLNALIYPGIKMSIQKNAIVSIFHTAGGGQGDDTSKNDVVARTYLLKLKNNDETTKLAAIIKDYAPSELQ